MKNRRDFIKTCSRMIMATGLAGVSFYLITRQSDEQPCDFNFPCKKCKQLPGCNNQKAIAVKNHPHQNTSGEDND